MTTGIIDANGKPANGEEIAFEVHMRYHPLTGQLQMEAKCPNHDTLMNILLQAQRALDVQMRIAAGLAAQQQVKRDSAILDFVKNRPNG